MPNIKPYLTTDDLVEAVKLTMSFPLSQNSFTYNNVVTFLNQELQLNAVPTLMEEHQEYLVYRKTVPLLTNISRYTIPDRAIGMSLRDVKFADSGGNYYDITRIAPDDKAFFQQSNGSNQTIGKFYLEGNELVLTPKLLANPTGSLVLFYFLRPNYLVRNDRACIIQHFHKDLTIVSNSALVPGDIIEISLNNQTENPIEIILTAVNSSAQTISGVSTSGVITTVNAHNLPINENFTITLTGVSTPVGEPDINGTYNVISTGANTFQLAFTVDVARSGGSYSVENQFVIDTTSALTAIKIANTINSISIDNPEIKNLNIDPTSSLADGLFAQASGSIVQFNYLDISATFEILNTNAFELDNSTIEIQFNQLPTLYTDPETDIQSDLYSNGCLVDFLQTSAGHRTYTYDIKLISIANESRGKFYVNQLKEYPSNSVGGVLEFYPIKVGDYICLQNECIIPQIPPELHHALAERAASRVLMAIGDKEGYAISLNKIKEMDDKQSTLIGSRVESSVPKVFNRYSLLRLGKSRFRRRY